MTILLQPACQQFAIAAFEISNGTIGKTIRALVAYEGTFVGGGGASRTFTPTLLQSMADASNEHLKSGIQAPIFYSDHDYSSRNKVGLIRGPFVAQLITDADLPDPNLADLVGKVGLFTQVELIKEDAIADYDAKLLKPISMGVDFAGRNYQKNAIFEISCVGFSAIPGAQLFAGQARRPAGGPDGGQFAPKEGAGEYTSVKGFDKVEIESVGEFTPTAPDLLAEGGAIAAGSIEVNTYTAHTDKDDRDEGISDQYFVGMGKATYDDVSANPDLLKAVIAVRAEHVAKGAKDDFIDLPGTNYKLYSDPSTPEFPSLFTKEEYDHFSLSMKHKNMKLDFKAMAQQALTLSEQSETFGMTLAEQVAEDQLVPNLYRLFDSFLNLIRELWNEEDGEIDKEAVIQQAVSDLTVGLASKLRTLPSLSMSAAQSPQMYALETPEEEEDMSQLQDLQQEFEKFKLKTQVQSTYHGMVAKATELFSKRLITPAQLKEFEAASIEPDSLIQTFSVGSKTPEGAIATLNRKMIELETIEKYAKPHDHAARLNDEPLLWLTGETPPEQIEQEAQSLVTFARQSNTIY